MKRLPIFAFVIAVLVTASCSNSTSDLESNKKVGETVAESAEDKKAIETAYDNWYTAWESKDYKLAAQDYSDDAFWMNAFGMKRTGRAEIENALKGVFALDFVMAGESKTVEKTIRFLRPTVALVESRVEREGQEAGTGEELETRKTTHLRVFVKSNGKWQIVSHLISDARSMQSRQH